MQSKSTSTWDTAKRCFVGVRRSYDAVERASSILENLPLYLPSSPMSIPESEMLPLSSTATRFARPAEFL